MKRILLLPMSWGRGIGPLAEMLGVIRELKQYDWEISIAVKTSWVPLVRGRASIDYVFELPEPDVKPVSHQFFTDFPSFQGMADIELVMATIDAERRAISAARPDVVFSNLQPTATLSTELERALHANVVRMSESAEFLARSGHLQSAASGVLCRAARLSGATEPESFWGAVVGVADLSLAPTLRAWEEGLFQLVPGAAECGYFTNFDWSEDTIHSDLYEEWLNDSGPKVYAYMSSKGFGTHVYLQPLASAAGRLGARVLLSSRGDENSPRPGRYGAVTVVPWCPAVSASTASDVVISVGTRTNCMQAILGAARNLIVPNDDYELSYVRELLTDIDRADLLVGSPRSANAWEASLSRSLNIETADKEMAKNQLELSGGPVTAAKALDELVG